MTIFTIKVNYKSGISHMFDVTEFSIEGDSWTWAATDKQNKPVLLGVENVESVWQVGIKENNE